ncbi:transposase [Mycobacterium lacus]|uniref:transposase n=1 Tax=Mycobacterium lacus TaxID=169765 RepID=UPI0038B3FE9A
MKVSADGAGVVSHAGVGMLREVADLTGLSSQVTAVLADTYRGPWMHAPGVVFADLAAAVADGADCIDSVGALWVTASRRSGRWPRRARCGGWLMSASTPRICRGFGRPARMPAPRRGRPGGPEHGGWLHLDVDATICVDHSDNKENAAATWKKTFGFHPLLVFLDRPDIAAGEALAGLLRAGNAGSNTTADHITVLEQALESLPAAYRPDPDNPDGPAVLIRSDSAGATYGFAAACRTAHVGSPWARSSTPACKTLSRSSTTPMPGIRPSTPTAPSATAPGRRGHRSGGSVGLAGRHAVGPTQGAPAPRRPVAVHRF